MKLHAALTLAAFGCSFSLAQAAGNAFDGTWSVNHACAVAPDGALPFTINYSMKVSNGIVDGEYNPGHNSGYFHIQGQIADDGNATFHMTGLTGQRPYNPGRTSPGLPFSYDFTGTFGGSRGTGHRVGILGRVCDFTFVKRG